MNLNQVIEIYSGGPGSGCNPEVAKCGRHQSRTTKAKSYYVPHTKQKALIAFKWARKIANIIGGKHTGDNRPMDVMLGTKGVEVKTVQPGAKNDKLTMHSADKHDIVGSHTRKVAYSALSGKKILTIAVDLRQSKPVFYIKEGVGSFRLKYMQRIDSPTQLKSIAKNTGLAYNKADVKSMMLRAEKKLNKRGMNVSYSDIKKELRSQSRKWGV